MQSQREGKKVTSTSIGRSGSDGSVNVTHSRVGPDIGTPAWSVGPVGRSVDPRASVTRRLWPGVPRRRLRDITERAHPAATPAALVRDLTDALGPGRARAEPLELALYSGD